MFVVFHFMLIFIYKYFEDKAVEDVNVDWEKILTHVEKPRIKFMYASSGLCGGME